MLRKSLILIGLIISVGALAAIAADITSSHPITGTFPSAGEQTVLYSQISNPSGRRRRRAGLRGGLRRLRLLRCRRLRGDLGRRLVDRAAPHPRQLQRCGAGARHRLRAIRQLRRLPGRLAVQRHRLDRLRHQRRHRLPAAGSLRPDRARDLLGVGGGADGLRHQRPVVRRAPRPRRPATSPAGTTPATASATAARPGHSCDISVINAIYLDMSFEILGSEIPVELQSLGIE